MNQMYMFTQPEIIISLDTDLTGATNVIMLVKKPSGTVGYRTATVSGKNVKYTMTAGELDEPGLWQFEAKVNLSGKKYSSIQTQVVEKPLDV